MKAEIIAVGTELLMGQIVNSNAQFIAQRLNEMGLSHHIQTVVGDNPERLIAVIQQAEQRSDIIILTGGIGPTRDDLTKECLGEYLNEELVIDSESLENVKASFKGRVMVSSNEKMAATLANGDLMPNDNGQAIGTVIEKNQHLYLIFPGPPKELQAMFRNYGQDYIRQWLNEDLVIKSRYLRFFGIGESLLADKLDDLIRNQENPTLATYASDYTITVRITASAQTQEEADGLIADMIAKIEAIAGEYIFGEGEHISPAHALQNKLKADHLRIAFAESLTAGLAADLLASVPGASAVLEGGLVTYSRQAKQRLLEIPKDLLDSEGMVSEACARAMAEKTREKFASDIAVSFTGVAGPDSLEGHKPGTVFVGFAYKNGHTQVKSYHFNGNREAVRHRVVYAAYLELIN
ncbi:competence/damage-inducible protein A [Aerococcus kribbianus]|uniref:Putative competence-damage inducible protein n=1 Tax=Aerococcus kribbianus TaxID=2999064 RepID=A0A9X3JFI6_9LACT|nr:MULTISPECIES: competence/damage-inducible protein A [unclassified Aerococcus]MCZ0717678.1 competence/damage-inducible protein A [Aerococcus sp. YH-aer221]MCZ0725966.1 competence/damage-inducible protein A [Aerococcus sp. YH-aer222]